MQKLAQTENGEGRAALLRILGQIGENRSLPLLRQALEEKDPAVFDAAVRALAEWPHPAARYDLLQLSETVESDTHKILALRAYIRMVEMEPHLSPRGAVECLTKALRLSTRAEEKKLILGVLPKFSGIAALKLAQSLLPEKAVKAEAEEAVKKITQAMKK